VLIIRDDFTSVNIQLFSSSSSIRKRSSKLQMWANTIRLFNQNGGWSETKATTSHAIRLASTRPRELVRSRSFVSARSRTSLARIVGDRPVDLW
jgi:hypothetical protein